MEICNDPAHHLMGNSRNLRSNVIVERINCFGIVSIDCLLDIPAETNTKGIGEENIQATGRGWSV